MKFEDLLMQPSEEKQKVKDLEEEVVVGKRCTSGFVWSYTESSIRFVSVLPSSCYFTQVEKLQQELDGELQLQRVLQCALQQPFHSRQFVSSFLPPKVRIQECYI